MYSFSACDAAMNTMDNPMMKAITYRIVYHLTQDSLPPRPIIHNAILPPLPFDTLFLLVGRQTPGILLDGDVFSSLGGAVQWRRSGRCEFGCQRRREGEGRGWKEEEGCGDEVELLLHRVGLAGVCCLRCVCVF